VGEMGLTAAGGGGVAALWGPSRGWVGRGAVLVRHESGAYQVVSAIGMGPRWSPGALVGERYGRWSRPLR